MYYQAHLGTGKAYINMEMWSQVRHHLETAYEAAKDPYEEHVASFHIEKLFVDQYCTDKQLVHVSGEQRMELRHKALDYARNSLSSSLEEDDDRDYKRSHQLNKLRIKPHIVIFLWVRYVPLTSTYVMHNFTIFSANRSMQTSF